MGSSGGDAPPERGAGASHGREAALEPAALEPAPPFELELELERAWGELAAELPEHLRAFARAHAAGAPAPPAPRAARRSALVALARRGAAYPALAARGLALLRLALPVIVEGDPAVAGARAAALSWPALAALAATREAASRARFGLGFVELAHGLHGAPLPGRPSPVLELREAREPPAGWAAPDRADHAIGPAEIEEIWRALAQRHGVAGRLQLVASAAARPRAFLVEPGREVIAVVPARVETPAARFAVLHELGHALAGLASRSALPRAVDEAAASYAARAMEAPAHPWHSPLAAAARARRTALAAWLDDVERAGASAQAGGQASDGEWAGASRRAVASINAARPPWALWHDPGAQASYVRAEQIADAWADARADTRADTRANVSADAWIDDGGGSFARKLATEAEVIDRGALAVVRAAAPR